MCPKRILTKELVVNNIKLMEVYGQGRGSSKEYSLRHIYINPSHILCLREELVIKRLLTEGKLIEGLDKRQNFTRITVNKSAFREDIVVVGSIHEIQKKLNIDNRELLRG